MCPAAISSWPTISLIWDGRPGFFGDGNSDDCFREMSARFRLWARVNQHQYLARGLLTNFVFRVGAAMEV